MAPDPRVPKPSNPRFSKPLDPRVSNAFAAMNCLGIPPEDVKPVLKHLLKLYNQNWDLIKEDNYRTLADAIFESADEKREQKRKTAVAHDQQEPPLKRTHSGESEDEDSCTGGNGSKVGLETGETQGILIPQRFIKSSQSGQSNRIMESNPDSHQAPCGYKAKGPISTNVEHVKPKITSQRASCSSGSDTRVDGTHITDMQRKRSQKAQDGELKPIAKLPPLALQGSNSNSPSLVTAQQHHNALDRKRSIHKIKDIAKGMEKVKISLLDEVGVEQLPKFVYIPQNTPYQDAYVPFSLARIADEDCCSSCIGDCLSASVPCACARDTGGEFAYTPQGLLKEEFLGACISMNREPQEHHLFHCQDCPLERAKNVLNPEPCKGHLLRKFIKECWRKCGCSMQCGNRVVQRGITCSLQVFLTEGKGWGIRTLEDLPKGSFVCEYVGEILTNMELYERNKASRENERHTYPVYLDADWGSEQVLKDEEALCLDATYYGNVARFINHRCYDSNLLEIPVEVETPDHHYYHIAFFTKKNVKAYEELTWDYGIDFQDDDHPIEAFECRCSSSFCRDGRRKDSKAIVPFRRPTTGRIIEPS